MSWSKKASVAYHFLEAADDEYFIKLQNSFDAIINSGEVSGSFESSETHFLWKINGTEDLTDTKTYFISLVKERSSWPVWFNDDGAIGTVPLTDGALGELYYAFINPAKKFMLSVSAAGGAAAGSYKKLLNEFSLDGGVKTTPLYENNIDKKTLLWDYYKKIGVSMNFPTHDDLAEFKTTKEGAMLGLIDALGGLKIDFTISTTKQKQVLDAAELRDTVKNLLENDFCGKLVLRGADFESETPEEYDLKNAQVKYSELVEIVDSFMSDTEAIGLLRRAFYERAKDILMIPEGAE